MATLDDLKNEVDSLQQVVDDTQQRVQDTLDRLNATIADLTDLVEQGGTAEQRQAIVDELEAIKADLASTLPGEPPVV